MWKSFIDYIHLLTLFHTKENLPQHNIPTHFDLAELSKSPSSSTNKYWEHLALQRIVYKSRKEKWSWAICPNFDILILRTFLIHKAFPKRHPSADFTSKSVIFQHFMSVPKNNSILRCYHIQFWNLWPASVTIVQLN